MSKRTARIELRPADEDYFGQPPKLSARPHYLRLVSANGQILAHSENYASRRNARRAVKAWLEAFFQVGGGDDPDCRPVPVVEFTANGSVR